MQGSLVFMGSTIGLPGTQLHEYLVCRRTSTRSNSRVGELVDFLRIPSFELVCPEALLAHHEPQV